MRKLTFFAALAVVVLSACKKDKSEPEITPTPTPQVTYPITYEYSAFVNPGPIRVFTKTAEISAPNHMTAKYDDLVNIEETMAYLDEENKASKLVILNDHQLVNIENDGTRDTAAYTVSGNDYEVNILGYTLIWTKSGNNLTLKYSKYVKQPAATPAIIVMLDGPVNGKDLMKSVQRDMVTGDTAAARTFEMKYLKK